jgi:organic radical activating enzyme/uridine kinase
MFMHPDDVRRDFRLLRAAQAPAAIALPRLLTIHPTDVCNHSCPWCWFDRTSEAVNMPDSVRLIRCLSHQIDEVIVSGGGEPLLHPDIQTLCDSLSEYPGLHRRLYTNGSAFHTVERLHLAFDYIRVSLDSGDAGLYATLHGTRPEVFNRIFTNLAELNAAGCAVGVSMVLTNENVHTIEPLLQRCLLDGIRYVFLKPLMEGMARIDLPTINGRYASGDVDVYVRTASGMIPAPPPSTIVAKLAVTVTADSYIHPCCHLTSAEWRVAALAEIDWSDRVVAQHNEIANRYAASPHACRMHDAWQALWLSVQRKLRATHAVARHKGSGQQSGAGLAGRIAATMKAEQVETIGVTGPSSVGKTVMADEIASALVAVGLRATRISTDDFLRRELRGEREYRKDRDQPLAPADYDFDEVAQVIGRVCGGEAVEWLGYERGAGWVRPDIAVRADVLVVDGLFLDEVGVIDVLDLDMTIVMEAPNEAIASWRRERDASVRRHSGGSFRTEAETENEILRTIASYMQYAHAREHDGVLLIELDANHLVRNVRAAGQMQAM